MKTYLRVFAENSAWLLAARLANFSSTLLIFPLLARYLEPEGFGTFNYSLSVVGLFAVFGNMGLQGLVVRLLVADRTSHGQILFTGFILKLVGTIVGLLLLGASLYIGLIESADAQLFIIVFAVTLLFVPFTQLTYYFEAEEKNHFVAIADISSTLLGAAMKMIFIVVQLPLHYLAIILVIETGSNVFIRFTMFQRNFIRRDRMSSSVRYCNSQAKRMLKESWPLVLAGFGAYAYLKIDQIMLHEMINSSEVGIYASAARISESWYFVPAIFSTVVFPQIVKFSADDRAKYLAFWQQYVDIVTWFGIIVAIAVLFFGEVVIEIFFGVNFLAAATILKIHIWGGVFIIWGQILSRWLISEGFTILSIYRQIGGGVVNIILNFWLIPMWGGTGAAIASIFSYFVASFLICFASKKTRSLGVMMIVSLAAPVTYFKYFFVEKVVLRFR